VLLASGKEVPCSIPVHDWTQHGSCFRKLLRRRSTTKVVLHWTGAENPAHAVYDHLLEKQLSIHLVIDQAGKVWQFADLDDTCWHAGRLDDGFTSANEDTIGIEIINRASHTQSERWQRPMLTELVHGVRDTREGFLPAQIESAVALTKALCAHYKLPTVPPITDGRVTPKALSTARWRSHKGVAGHFHARSTKVDPGIELLSRFLP
jgi:N-acetyl-anhydromuramyl-L-alanine amidase AmpD